MMPITLFKSISIPSQHKRLHSSILKIQANKYNLQQNFNAIVISMSKYVTFTLGLQQQSDDTN